MRRAVAMLLVFGACHGADAPRPALPRPGDPIAPGGAPTHAVKVEVPSTAPPPASTVAGRRRGTPHRAQITSVVLDADGTRALTADGLGGLRVWPALDGTREPQVLPLRDAQAMAIAARGDGSLAALIDSAGGLRLLDLDRDGVVRATASLPPDITFAGVAILPGGERVAALRADQRVVLLDADGTERGRLAIRGTRVVALHAVPDGLLAIVARGGGQGARYELRRIARDGDRLDWDGSGHALPAPVALLPHVASAVSPDGALLAYIAEGKSEPHVRVVEVATGAAIRLDDVAAVVAGTATVGFTGARRAEAASLSGRSWRIEIDGGRGTVISAVQATATSAPAYAPDLRAAGYHAHLVLRAPDGDVEYLGHRELYSTTAALSADGTAAAWITSTGAALIQRFDGAADVRVKQPADWFGSAAFVDGDHVLLGRNNGQLALFGADGTEKASLVVATSVPWFAYEPSTRLAAVLRDPGVVWVIPIDPASADRPLGAPIAVGDGAQSFALLDPALSGGDALATFDGAGNERRYTLDELADGVGASEMKKDRTGVSTMVMATDRAGRSYVLDGTRVRISRGGHVERTLELAGTPAGVFPTPDGARVAVIEYGPNGAAQPRVYDGASGALLWQGAAVRGAFTVTWSGDGRRAVVQSHGTALVVDGATGEAIAAGEGWAFARTHEAPTALPTNTEAALR